MNKALKCALFFLCVLNTHHILCQAKSYNLLCYYCMAHAEPTRGGPTPTSPPPHPDSRAREGGGVYSIEVPAPGAGPTTWGGPTPLNRKKGVPTLPFIA